jgi:hypothetical protein
VLAAYGLAYFMKTLDWKRAVYCVIGCAGLALTRGDSLFFALLFLLALGLVEIYKRKRFPVKTFCSGLLFLGLISPWVIYEYNQTGWPVTELRQAIILDRLFKTDRAQSVSVVNKPATVPVQVHSAARAAKPAQTVAPLKAVEATQRVKPVSVVDTEPLAEEKGEESFIENLLKGFYPQYLIFILPVIIFRIYRKKMSGGEFLLLAVVLLHAIGMIGQIAVADKKLFIYKRYLIVATPLMFGWGAIGLRWLYDNVKSRLRLKFRWICKFALCVVIVIFTMDGWSRVRKKRINPYLYRAVETCTGVQLRK